MPTHYRRREAGRSGSKRTDRGSGSLLTGSESCPPTWNSAGELPAGLRRGPAGEPGRERGDSGGAPVPAMARRAAVAGFPPVRFSYQNAPSRSWRRLAAEPGERRTARQSGWRPCRSRLGEVLEHPADPRGAAVEPDVHAESRDRPGSSSQTPPRTATRRSQLPACRATHTVGGVAGCTGGAQVDPGDPGDSELEAGGRPGTRVSGERPADRSRRARRPSLVVDPREQPARRREIDADRDRAA